MGLCGGGGERFLWIGGVFLTKICRFDCEDLRYRIVHPGNISSVVRVLRVAFGSGERARFRSDGHLAGLLLRRRGVVWRGELLGPKCKLRMCVFVATGFSQNFCAFELELWSFIRNRCV